MDIEEVGAALKELRARAHATQADAGHAAGVTASFVSQVEKGRKRPAAEVLLSLLRFYDAEERFGELAEAIDAQPGPSRTRRADATIPGVAAEPRPIFESVRRLSDLVPGQAAAWIDREALNVEGDPEVIGAAPEDGEAAREDPAEVTVPSSCPVHPVPADSRVEVMRLRSGQLLVRLESTKDLPASNRSDRLVLTRVTRFPSDVPDWSSYADTDITIRPDGGSPITVGYASSPADQTGFPTWRDLAADVDGSPERIVILTAQHPAWALRGPTETARDMAMLRHLLMRPGLMVLPAEMKGGGLRENGFAVAMTLPHGGGERWDVVALAEIARHFDQESFFEWTPSWRRVVPTRAPSEGWVHGWQLQEDAVASHPTTGGGTDA